jgi:hypothetical protein
LKINFTLRVAEFRVLGAVAAVGLDLVGGRCFGGEPPLENKSTINNQIRETASTANSNNFKRVPAA